MTTPYRLTPADEEFLRDLSLDDADFKRMKREANAETEAKLQTLSDTLRCPCCGTYA